MTEMLVNLKAATQLCVRAGTLRDRGEPDAVVDTLCAKYFSSRIAVRAASDAVQMHGANGCNEAYPVGRFLRDAKVMEIIEGSNQVLQLEIAEHAYQIHDQGLR